MEKIVVCPMPDPWNRIYQELLIEWQKNPVGKYPPPVPLILGGWNFSDDFDKKARWNLTKKWANEVGLNYLIPELPLDQLYSVWEMKKIDWEEHSYWNYESRKKPTPEQLESALETLISDWATIVGENTAIISKPIKFTGKKGRRLVVLADHKSNPPWGEWSKKSSGPERITFTEFRKNINLAISPLEVDHIDFIF